MIFNIIITVWLIVLTLKVNNESDRLFRLIQKLLQYFEGYLDINESEIDYNVEQTRQANES